MANVVKFFESTEAEILALTSASDNWVEKAFYYPTDKNYFYRITSGVMTKYGDGDTASIGIGITLNGKVIGGVKTLIEQTDTLQIPENWDYNVIKDLTIEGEVFCEGEINIF